MRTFLCVRFLQHKSKKQEGGEEDSFEFHCDGVFETGYRCDARLFCPFQDRFYFLYFLDRSLDYSSCLRSGMRQD